MEEIKLKIAIGKKEYKNGKITKDKYKQFTDTVKSMEKHSYFQEEDIEKMQNAIINFYDNQFTIEEMDEYWGVDDIIFNFSMINVDLMNSLNEKAKKAQKVFQKANK